mgnify:CR=1 FL=1
MFCLKLSMKLFVPRVLEVKNSSGFLEKQFCSSGAVIKEPIEHRHIRRRHDRYLLSGHYLCSVRRRFSRSAIKTRHVHFRKPNSVNRRPAAYTYTLLDHGSINGYQSDDAFKYRVAYRHCAVWSFWLFPIFIHLHYCELFKKNRLTRKFPKVSR